MENHKLFLSINLKRGFTPPNLPIATFTQGNKELNFIIDTGADDNVICTEALQGLKYDVLDSTVPLATGAGVVQAKVCNLSFQFQNEVFTSKFLISDHLKPSFDAIHEWNAVRLHGSIGAKFLMENGIVLDFHNMIAYNKKT